MKNDAVVTVGADASAFSKTMDGLARGISGKLEAIGKAFVGVLGVGAAARSVAQAFSAFTAPAAEIENVATSLAGVMQNREGAERLAKSLQRMATNGVVSLDELHRAARSLTNVFDDDRAVAHYTGMLANIAAGSKVPVERLANMVSRLNDMGKAEMTELANAGVPIYEALSSVMGKSREDIIKLGAEGKIAGSDLVAAFEKMTEAGARYHNRNAEMSNTTSGSWDTLKASITECMAALGTPVNDAVRPLLQDMANWLQKNKDKVEELARAVAPVFQGIAQVVVTCAPAFVQLTTSVHTLTIALAILAQKMWGPVLAGFGRLALAFKPALVGLRNFRMAVTLTGSLWQATMAGMAVAARTAALAIKAALASTGIGIAVWLLGEGVAWLIEKFGDAGEAAKAMGEDAAEAAEAAHEASMRELKEKEDANRLERERTQQMEEQARLAKEAADAERDRLRTVSDMVAARDAAAFEQEMDALRELPDELNGGAAGVIAERLRRAGHASEDDLYAERDRLERNGSMSEEQLARYKVVAAAIDKIEEEHRKAADAADEHKKRVRELQNNYYDRKSRYKRSRMDARYDEMSTGAQERALQRRARDAGYWGDMNPAAIREHMDALNRQNAEGNVRQIAELERILELHDALVERKQKYQDARKTDMQEMRIQALELAGRKRAADELRRELELQQRINVLRERGASKNAATEQAEMEARLKQAQALRDRIQSARVEFIQSDTAAVGGGGVSYRLGTVQLAESKKHSKLLKEIRDYLRPNKNSSTVAVLA